MIPGMWWINESWGQPQRCIRREQARSLCFTILGNKGSQQSASPASLIARICSRDGGKRACRFRGHSLSAPETIEQKPKGYMCLAIWGRCSENGEHVFVYRESGPALPHSHVPLKGRYDTSYSLSGRIMWHSSYWTVHTNAGMVHRLMLTIWTCLVIISIMLWVWSLASTSTFCYFLFIYL